MSKLIPNQPNHTELRKGEKLLRNMTIHEFDECPWDTKRRGNFPCDEHGQPINPAKDCLERLYPIFVQQEELDIARTVAGR